MTILYAGDASEADQWLGAVQAIDPSLHFRRWPDHGDPADIDFIIVGGRMPGDFSAFTKLRGIQSTWAGVNHLLLSGELPPGVPVARMVDDGLTCSMSEYLVFQVLDQLRHGRELRAAQRDGIWAQDLGAAYRYPIVGIMGLGKLGQDTASQLSALGITLRGWSRTAKIIEGVECFAGQSALSAFLGKCEILICLLPLTPDTSGILDRRLFDLLPDRACLINAARGPHLVEDDLLAALDSGKLNHAVLDVFAVEPLPSAHRFWTHPKVTVTPHIAAITRPGTGATLIVENYRRALAGEALKNQVDVAQGY
ncbi:MAG: glyoxylate/hydroxypyruvate reductase A [Dongiaceae bacterium]